MAIRSGYYEPDLSVQQDETIETHGRYVVLELGNPPRLEMASLSKPDKLFVVNSLNLTYSKSGYDSEWRMIQCSLIGHALSPDRRRVLHNLLVRNSYITSPETLKESREDMDLFCLAPQWVRNKAYEYWPT